METRLNIAKILKDKPVNTRLYSPIFGNCILGFPKDMIIIDKSGETRYFYDDGRFFVTGDCLLFPSKEMRDWSKFAWKKGDVLVSDYGTVEVIFDCFDDDTYASFKGKHALKTVDGGSEYIGDSDDDYGVFYTGNYLKESEAPAQTYIKTIEKRLGGKLNLETLEIEKTQPEFKDGDIVFVESHMLGINTSSMIAIFRKEEEIDKYKFSPALCESNEHDTYLREDSVVLSPSGIKIFRPATDSEKQQLFDALVEECKAWDAENKQIVDLKPKVEFKPFDRVLVRDCLDEMWRPSFFACYLPFGREPYQVIGGEWVKLCIPYEGNEHLLGTTKDVED